jgi:hypothetical protein
MDDLELGRRGVVGREVGRGREEDLGTLASMSSSDDAIRKGPKRGSSLTMPQGAWTCDAMTLSEIVRLCVEISVVDEPRHVFAQDRHT